MVCMYFRLSGCKLLLAFLVLTLTIQIAESYRPARANIFRTTILSATQYKGRTQKYASTASNVFIESPTMNSRVINASTMIAASMDTVWEILTDYNRLADRIPNLTKSYLVPAPPNTTRLFQEGAQNIIGFDFRASVTMDMTEDPDNNIWGNTQKKLRFKLVNSVMFSNFDGTWSLSLDEFGSSDRTILNYSVYVRPKGPVPVLALEWRIKEDVPINLAAVKLASERKEVQASSNLVKSRSTGIATKPCKCTFPVTSKKIDSKHNGMAL